MSDTPPHLMSVPGMGDPAAGSLASRAMERERAKEREAARVANAAHREGRRPNLSDIIRR